MLQWRTISTSSQRVDMEMGRVTLKRAMTDSCWGKATSERMLGMNEGIVVLLLKQSELWQECPLECSSVLFLFARCSQGRTCCLFAWHFHVQKHGDPTARLHACACFDLVLSYFVSGRMQPNCPLQTHSDLLLLGLWPYRFQVTQAFAVPFHQFLWTFCTCWHLL